jgi:hypothetical protein
MRLLTALIATVVAEAAAMGSWSSVSPLGSHCRVARERQPWDERPRLRTLHGTNLLLFEPPLTDARTRKHGSLEGWMHSPPDSSRR